MHLLADMAVDVTMLVHWFAASSADTLLHSVICLWNQHITQDIGLSCGRDRQNRNDNLAPNKLTSPAYMSPEAKKNEDTPRVSYSVT
jgi:hypothetical protein